MSFDFDSVAVLLGQRNDGIPAVEQHRLLGLVLQHLNAAARHNTDADQAGQQMVIARDCCDPAADACLCL